MTENEMNNQAAQTMPELPASRGYLSLYHSGGVAQVNGYTADQMHQYARDYAAALSQTAGVPDGWKLVPVEPTEVMCEAAMSSLGWTRSEAAAKTAPITPASPMMEGSMKVWSAMLAAAPAASGGEDKGDPVCREDDGCPTEGAVLKRFWRAVNTDDTKQLMAFYGVADVPALIEQQVQHVQSLQIKLKAHEPKRDQFPKSPREG